MTRRTTLELILATLVVAGLAPMADAAPLRQHGFRTARFTTENGLPQNSVTSILEADDGYLWIGTHGGLVRYDGTSFDVFDGVSHPELVSVRISALAEDHAGDLWVGTMAGGVLRMRDGRFESFTGESAPSGYVHDIVCDGSGAVWFAASGIVRFADGEFTEIGHLRCKKAGCETTSLALADDGRVWVASRCCLGYVDGGRWTKVRVSEVFEHVGVGPDDVWSFGDRGLRDADGTPWDDPPDLARVAASLVDRNGVEWVVGDGVWRRIGGRLLPVDVPDDARDCMSIAESSGGTLWLGTRMNGLVRLRRTRFDSVSLPRPGRTRTPAAVVGPDGGLRWIASTDEGVVQCVDGAWRVHPAAEELEEPSAALGSASGGLWVASGEGVLLRTARDGSVVERHRHELGRVFRMLEHDGALWFFGRAGLGRLSEGRIESFTSGFGSRSHVPPIALAPADEDAIWIGAMHSVYRFSGGVVEEAPWAAELPRSEIRSLHESPQGVVWVATYGRGLLRVEDGAIEAFTTRDGLPDAALGAIVPDDEGRLWINSNATAFRLDPRDVDAYRRGERGSLGVVPVGTGEGNGASGGPLRGGRLWLPTTSSIVVIDPGTFDRTPSPSRLVVTDVRADGSSQPLSPDGTAVSIAPGARDVAIEFAVVAPEGLDGVRLQYRLDGVDSEWVDAGASRAVHYPQLVPGAHRFHLRALDPATGTGEELVVDLDLPRRFWESPAFFGLLAFAVAGLALWLHRARLDRVRRRNAVLSAEVASRERAERALREKDERLQLALASAECGTWRWEPESGLIERDGVLSEMLGLGCTTTVTKQAEFVSRIHPDDRAGARAELERALGERTPLAREFRIVRPDGEERWFKDRGMPIHGPDGRLMYVTGASIDITDRRSAEEERARLDATVHRKLKLEAIGQLAAGVAHEFNNLLVGVLGRAELLRDSKLLPDDSPAHQWIADIARSGTRAAKLTRKLLSFSKDEPASRETFDVGATIREALHMLASVVSERIAIETDLDEEPLLVNADPAQLEQGLLNLVLNARDAIPDRGTIRIRTDRVTLSEAEAEATGNEPGRYVRISVEDDGCGMSPFVTERAFEPFFTTKALGEGTGLGLSTLAADVARVGGHVEVDSHEGTGSVFRILLPLVDDVVLLPTAPESPRVEHARTADPRDATILVCDDDELVLVTISSLLREAGYVVLRALGAEQALGLASDYDGAISLLVVDVVMPTLSGVELAAELQHRRPGLEVLYISGYPSSDFGGDEIEDPRRLLRKPASRAALLDRVREILAGAPSA